MVNKQNEEKLPHFYSRSFYFFKILSFVTLVIKVIDTNL